MPKFPLRGFAALAILAAPAALAQEMSPAAPALSNPLADYTLRYLLPVRTVDDLEAERATAIAWKKWAAQLATRAKDGGLIASQKIAIKKAEIKTLVLRRKAAKKAKEGGREEEIKAAIQREKEQLDVLELIKDLSKIEADVAKRWADAAEALGRSSRAELDLVRYRDDRAAVFARTQQSGETIPLRDPRGWGLHETHAQASKELGSALAKFGKEVEKYHETRAKLLRAWKARNLE
jgi:hypothetical protein